MPRLRSCTIFCLRCLTVHSARRPVGCCKSWKPSPSPPHFLTDANANLTDSLIVLLDEFAEISFQFASLLILGGRQRLVVELFVGEAEIQVGLRQLRIELQRLSITRDRCAQTSGPAIRDSERVVEIRFFDSQIYRSRKILCRLGELALFVLQQSEVFVECDEAGL